MCFYFHQSKSAVEVAQRYNIYNTTQLQISQGIYNGFMFPLITTIHQQNSQPTLQQMQWGLIPD
jgi:putative SOS response-associated peptidase YedK